MGAEIPVIVKLRTVHDRGNRAHLNGYGSAARGVSPGLETDIASYVSTGREIPSSMVQFQLEANGESAVSLFAGDRVSITLDVFTSLGGTP
jgi:hypothetical protein